MEVATEVLNQINDRKSEIEECGVKVEDVLPHIRTTFKMILDGILVHKRDRRKGLLLDVFEHEYESPKV